MLTPLALLVAVLLAAPALWASLVDHDLSLTDALIRLLIAIMVAAVMLAVLRWLTAGYRARADERVADQPAGRRDEPPQS